MIQIPAREVPKLFFVFQVLIALLCYIIIIALLWWFCCCYLLFPLLGSGRVGSGLLKTSEFSRELGPRSLPSASCTSRNQHTITHQDERELRRTHSALSILHSKQGFTTETQTTCLTNSYFCVLNFAQTITVENGMCWC